MSSRRGYALMAVIVITVLILSGASILLLVGRDASLTGIQEKRGTEAHGVALAGLQWMLANLNSQLGRDAAVECATSGVSFIANPTDASPKTVHRFNTDAAFVGVPGPPPAAGVSNTNWTAFGDGHYGLTVAVDPLDLRRSVLIRSVGVVGGRVVVLESNLRLNLVQTVPSGITGCFDADFQITYYDQEGPYDYVGNFRLDGGPGVPMAISADHNRINGLAREDGGSPAIFSAAAGYTQGRKWRGTQSLRGGLATGVTNIFGGTQSSTQAALDDNIGPLALWERNRYIANDPRLVDTFSTTTGPRGLGLGADGLVWNGSVVDVSANTLQQRGLPLIAYISAPSATETTDAKGGFLGQTNWGGDKDDEARKGFYACDNHGGGNASINDTIEVCAKGSTNTGAPDWSNNAVNHSGRAHGFVQSILRQCTGSGSSIDPVTGSPFFSALNPNGIKCSPGFEWLENAAACLVLPRTVANANGTNALRPAGDALTTNNFNGCHPGCLIATDVNGDDAITNEDRPFRSSCINLDAESVTTYGPGILTTKTALVSGGVVDPYAGKWQLYNTQATLAAAVTSSLDVATPTSAARFIAADKTTVLLGGAVRERGNDTLITRLDMSDRGPLGTCEQNCLAYGFGKDVTYGAFRTDIATPGVAGTASDPNCTARVPTHAGGGATVVEHCNWDRDGDGLLDRKSYALHSAYREECADPHDGVAWSPAFNISNANTNLGGAGCKNNLPERGANGGQRLVPFCDNGNDEELRAAIDSLELVATTVNASSLNKNTTDLADGDGWWGGAKCHMGTGTTFGGAAHTHSGNLATLPVADVDRLGHPDYWIEDTCPNPVVVRVDSSANLNIGKVCGCGVLLLPGQSMQFGATASLLWRGLVIWDLKGASGKELKIDGNGAASFIVDGGLLVAGDDGIEIKVTKGVSGGATIANTNSETVKQLYRMNPKAIEDAFSAVRAPVRTIRRVQ